MSTPEGKVKAAVKKLLESYDGIYFYMPVPGGFGKATLDYLCCVRGQFFAIETKAPGKKLTLRQATTVAEIQAAMGKVFVVDDVQGPAIEELRSWLNGITALIDDNPNFTSDPVRRRTI